MTRRLKVTVGVLLVLILLGQNYITNIPQAAQDSIMITHDLTTTQFNLLYSLETLPSIFLIIPLGILFDAYGTKLLIPASLLLVLGQGLLLTYTPLKSSFSFVMMILGRIMEGISGQLLYLAMGVMVTKWMGNLGGVIIVLPEVGQILNSFMTPILNISGGLYLVNIVGMTVCLVSFVSSILLWRVDRNYKQMAVEVGNGDQQEGGPVSCDAFSNFDKVYWIVILICAINEGIYIPSLYNANTLLQVRFGISYSKTGVYLTIPFLATMVATGVFAKLLSKYTKNHLILVAALGGLVAHSVIYLIPNSPQQSSLSDILLILSFVAFGIGKGCYYSIIYPAIGQVVNKEYRGTAYAVVSLMECLNISLLPEVSAWIIESDGRMQEGYKNSSILFIGMSVLGLVLTTLLFSMKVDYLCQKPDQEIIYSKHTESKENVQASSPTSEAIITETGDQFL